MTYFKVFEGFITSEYLKKSRNSDLLNPVSLWHKLSLHLGYMAIWASYRKGRMMRASGKTLTCLSEPNYGLEEVQPRHKWMEPPPWSEERKGRLSGL